MFLYILLGLCVPLLLQPLVQLSIFRLQTLYTLPKLIYSGNSVFFSATNLESKRTKATTIVGVSVV